MKLPLHHLIVGKIGESGNLLLFTLFPIAALWGSYLPIESRGLEYKAVF
jgi:hypothetical protein